MGSTVISEALTRHIIDVISKSTVPLSAEDIQQKLSERSVVYSYRHIKRKINQLESAGILEKVAKRSQLMLYSLPGQVLEPFQATTHNLASTSPQIKVGSHVYSPDELARALNVAPNTTLTEETYRNLSALLVLSILGNSAWEMLSAHSLTPVAHVRQPLIELNDRLKALSKMVDTIINHEHVKTGATGYSISDQTRDKLLADLEPWIMEVSTNVRSNIE